MKEFATSRNGYNKDEVQKYVAELEERLEKRNSEIDTLNKKLSDYIRKECEMQEKEANISIALTAAVEKAKQIEKSSSSVYTLKIEELEILYSRWEKVLNEIVQKYPNLDEVDNVKKLLSDFKSSIKSSLKEDFKFTNISSKALKSDDPMGEMIKKMNTSLEKQLEAKKPPKIQPRIRKQLSPDVLTKQSELNKLEEKSVMIKPIYDAKIEKGEKYESLLDKFLTQDATPDSAYANMLTAGACAVGDVNESGFNLKEAVNPKEDLETIMRSFDFFNKK